MMDEEEQRDKPDYVNSKQVISQPIIIVIVLVVGVFLGNLLAPKYDYHHSKLNTILNTIEEGYVDSVGRMDLVEATIPALLKQLDPHSAYIPAKEVEEMNAPLKGNFDGIGIHFRVQNDTILVVNTVANGPSAKVGILPGDRIVLINDSLFAGKGITDRDVVDNLKGERGSVVKVGVKRDGETELIDFEITRDKIPLYSVEATYMPQDGIGYIKLSRFASSSHHEMVEAMDKLLMDGMESLILDLRGNSGGYLEIATAIIDEFLEEKRLIVYTAGFSRPRASTYSTADGMCKDVKLYILIDSWSASASEIVAGSMQDNDRALVIGRRSFGKGLVQEPIMFSDSSEMRLTVARYYTPTGRCIQRSYDKGTEEYYKDLTKRVAGGHGVASGKQSDTLRFTTPKGKVVYGGGGVLPDVVVPMDSVGMSNYFNQVIRKGLVFGFAIKYTQQHRSLLNGFKGKDSDYLYDYLKSTSVFDEFLKYAQSKGVQRVDEEIARSEKLIRNRLYAYVMQNMLDETAFYKTLNKVDTDFQKALELATTKE